MKIYNKKRFFTFVFLLTLLITFLVIKIFKVDTYGAKENKSPEFTYYVVERGDSLWSIANKYRKNNESTKEFISHIKEYNKTAQDDFLIEGELVLLPNL